jgi:hypothetical protein
MCAISSCNINTSADVLTYQSKDVPHFKDCIGAIDGTHILATPPPQDYVRYIGTFGSATQNVMAMVDFDMRFTYASIGQPGSMHDTSVLYHAIEHDMDTFPHPPCGKFSSTHSYISLIHCICYFLCVSIFRKNYVVDSGYPNRLGYLSTYKGQRYHIPDFRRGEAPLVYGR